MGKKFHQNRSILLRFRDKQAFVFNAEIQDGRQKSDTLWVKNFIKISILLRFRDKCRNSRRLPKVAGKLILRNVANILCRYPACPKFCRNHPISLCFRHERVFAFYTEIQDARQKWQENYLCEKSPVDCRNHPGKKFRGNHSISLHFRGKQGIAFYAKIQDGLQK